MKKIIVIYLIWNALTLLFAYFGSFFLPLQKGVLGQTLWFGSPYLSWVWANFDGVRYISVASFGYQYPNFAFFPLLPFLLYLVNRYLHLTVLEGGLLIVHLFSFLSLFALYKILRLDFTKEITFRSLLFLVVFPFAFFYLSIYTESQYFFLATMSFYFARKSRWPLAGVFGYVAGLSRLVGIALFPALLLEWWLQQRQKKNIPALLKHFFKQHAYVLLLVPCGVITFGVYLQITQGDFFLFQKSMAEWGQSHPVFPLQVFFRYGKILLTAGKNYTYFIAFLEVLTTLCYLGLSLFVLLRVRLSYGVFMLMSLFIPMFTGTFQSMPRYLLHLFPAYVAMALLTKRSRILYYVVIMVSLFLQAVFITLFTRGFFVA